MCYLHIATDLTFSTLEAHWKNNHCDKAFERQGMAVLLDVLPDKEVQMS